jgi:hypothetical protein
MHMRKYIHVRVYVRVCTYKVTTYTNIQRVSVCCHARVLHAYGPRTNLFFLLVPLPVTPHLYELGILLCICMHMYAVPVYIH